MAAASDFLPSVDRQLGEHEVRIGAAEDDIAQIRDDLREIRKSLDELVRIASYGRGALRGALKLGGLFFALVAVTAYAWQIISGLLNLRR